MMVERVNIKMPPDVRDRFNEHRDGKKQAVFLNELLDLYEEKQQNEGDNSLTAEEVREIVREELRRAEEEQVRTIARETADELEERLQ